MVRHQGGQFTCDGKTAVPTPDDIAAIIYTSGTTGSAKGVVLSHRNLASNVITCFHSCPRNSKDRWLSLLPLAHTLEMTLCMLYPMFCGSTVYYLQKRRMLRQEKQRLMQTRPRLKANNNAV